MEEKLMEKLEYELDIHGLTVDFGNFKLDNITLGVPRGCITGLIGRNGAGKTTLIKTIMPAPAEYCITGCIFLNTKKRF